MQFGRAARIFASLQDINEICTDMHTIRSGFLPVIAFFVIFAATPDSVRAQADVASQYQETAQSLIDAALVDSAGWHRLTYLVDTFGPRFSGSESLEQAIDWVLDEMRRDGLENVRGEEVMVPKWVRGDESLTMTSPRTADMVLLGLGNSVGTPADGIRAEAIVVSSFDELRARADEAAGRIVVYDVPFTTYGETVQYRTRGAVEAARHGAVAALVRSVTPHSLYTPHTGMMRYEDGVERIPTAAITVEDAMLLHRLHDRGERIELELFMGAEQHDDVPSRNVVAELRGSERPEEVVVLGGHIDSWDVGTGAMDDAGGCVAAWQAVLLMKELGLRPRRTVRVVLWTNEENGLRGANAYRDQHRDELENHVLAIESDAGVFKPIGFGFGGGDEAFVMLQEVGSLLDPIDAGTITRGGGGADIGPIMREGVPGMGLVVDPTEYFWYHHTAADTMDKLDLDEFNRSVAAMAVMAYVVADMEPRLPWDTSVE